jgi:hypothetical protein
MNRSAASQHPLKIAISAIRAVIASMQTRNAPGSEGRVMFGASSGFGSYFQKVLLGTIGDMDGAQRKRMNTAHTEARSGRQPPMSRMEAWQQETHEVTEFLKGLNNGRQRHG